MIGTNSPNRTTRFSVVFVCSLCLLAATAAPAGEPAVETEESKTLYAIGLAMSQRLAGFELSEDELAVVQRGFADGMLRRDPLVELPEYGPKIDPYLNQRRTALQVKEVAAGTAFRTEAAKEPGIVTTDSGVLYLEREAGSGDAPTPTDTVRIHYVGTFRDGRTFDASLEEGGEPAEFALNEVVPCFSEGILRMRVGGKSKLVCPPELAYGDQGYGPMIPPGATLIFEIELLGIVAAPLPPPAPAPTMP
jgi:FKBP-type peptidyl-prolyl cis-trans isomerase